MEFGRPSYFQGQPTTSKDDSSTSSSVALGSDEAIVGACWTGNKNLLITSSSFLCFAVGFAIGCDFFVWALLATLNYGGHEAILTRRHGRYIWTLPSNCFL